MASRAERITRLEAVASRVASFGAAAFLAAVAASWAASAPPVGAPGPAPGSAPAGSTSPLGFVRACGHDVRAYCREVPLGGGRVLACLQSHEERLSGPCRAALDTLDADLANGALAGKAKRVDLSALPAGTRVVEDFAYGSDEAQRLDVYAPKGARDAPMIVMLHGGAWAFGDKRMRQVVQNKAGHWLSRGFVFVSVDTRLLPAADPLEQADDMAHALAAVQAHAKRWGGDASRLALMGHSAGAHVVALLTAAPEIAAKAGAKPWRATVSLDSAALDVPLLMAGEHLKLYDRAFGTDAALQRAASPYQRLAKATRPILLVCSTRRSDSCPQARAFAAKDRKLGGHAEVLPEDMTHLEINRDLGLPSGYTRAVDAFLAEAGVK